jgi:hypothetical protein
MKDPGTLYPRGRQRYVYFRGERPSPLFLFAAHRSLYPRRGPAPVPTVCQGGMS